MAASDRFNITIEGRGAHGAMPHLGADPVVAGAAVVTALQPLVSRETSPTDSAVITVARFNTGKDLLRLGPHSANDGRSPHAQLLLHISPAASHEPNRRGQPRL